MGKEISVEEMMKAGVHFGHQTFRRNPKMNKYIFGAKEGVHIIDLTKTETALVAALEFVKEIADKEGQIIFVGTKRQAGDLVKQYAESCGMPYVTQRWLGGLLTNHDTIKKRLKYLNELTERYKTNDFAGITKKEKVELDKEYHNLDRTLGGLRGLKGMPVAVFVVDIIKDKIAVTEANKLGIPVIATVDTNVDPDMVTHPIPGNDDAKKSIEYIVSRIALACGAKPVTAKEEKAEVQDEPIVAEETVVTE
jgi:small subunit ribosomal protein S2